MTPIISKYIVKTTDRVDLIESFERLDDAIACVCESYMEDEKECRKRVGLDIYCEDERIYCSSKNTDYKLIDMFSFVVWNTLYYFGENEVQRCNKETEAFKIICSINKHKVEEVVDLVDEEEYNKKREKLGFGTAYKPFILKNNELTMQFIF